MRKIGALPERQQAKTLSAHLASLGIENTLREYENELEIWVYDEDRLAEAQQEWESFRRNSADPRFRIALDAERKKPESGSRVKTPWPRSLSGRLWGGRIGPVTLVLLIISIGVYLLSFTPLGRPIYFAFLISHYAPNNGGISLAALQQVLSGQVWRLLTPIFLHFSLLHIIFNMIWLYQLGTIIEHKESSKIFTLQVLTIGIGSNLAQFWIAGPLFGGMSGIIYGLFGYIWLRSKFDPWSGYYINPSVVIMLLVWLALCFTGLLGPIANAAHVAGLILGGVWAWALSNRPALR